MLILLLTYILMSNALTVKSNRSLLYSRVSIQGLIPVIYIGYNTIYIRSLDVGISLYGGLFNISVLTQAFNMFVIGIGSIILILTAFYPRKIINYEGYDTILDKNPTNTKSETVKTQYKLYNETENSYSEKKIPWNMELILNKKSGQFSIIEYGLIIIFILSGASFLMSAGDLISIFLSIELQSYGLYILSTLYRDSESATGSGLTYFLLGGLSSCFILLGSALLYINSGSTNLDSIYIINNIGELCSQGHEKVSYWYQSGYFNFSFIVLIVGFLFKISAAPFHFWSPDVYDGIPTIVTTFVAIIAKISIFVIMLEFVLYTSTNYINKFTNIDSINDQFQWKNVLIISSLMSLVIGSVLGLTQYRIKRLFAYSTISHVGFILLALCIGKMESIQAYIFYILQYSLSNLNAFVILVTIGFTLYLYIYNNKEEYNNLVDVKNSPIQLISQLKGYFYINPFISISLAITLFSFVGIPPLIGFFAKQMVLSSALDQGYTFMTLIGIITSVIGAVYYLNLVKIVFFNKSNYRLSDLKSNNSSPFYNDAQITINSGLTITVSTLTMLILLFIFVPSEWFIIVNVLTLTLFKI